MSEGNVPTAATEAPPFTVQPSANDITMPLAQKVLSAIEASRDEARERDKKADVRFEQLESQIKDVSTQLESQIKEVAVKTDANTRLIGEQAEAITRVASAAAKAADIGLEAKQAAGEAGSRSTQIVESAIRIHGASIGVSINDAVKESLKPLAVDVESLKRSDADQAIALAALKKSDEETAVAISDQGKKIDGVVTSVGTIASGVAKLARWQDHWAVKVGIAVAAASGTFYAAMRAATPPPSPPSYVLTAPPQSATPLPFPPAPSAAPSR